MFCFSYSVFLSVSGDRHLRCGFCSFVYSPHRSSVGKSVSVPFRSSKRASRKRTSRLTSAGFISEDVRAFTCTCVFQGEKVWTNFKYSLHRSPEQKTGRAHSGLHNPLVPPQAPSVTARGHGRIGHPGLDWGWQSSNSSPPRGLWCRPPARKTD